MAKGLSQRGQFIAWVVLYGGAVWLMAAKSDENLANFAWGMALGVGAAVAATGVAVARWYFRLGVVAAWFFCGWMVGLALLWAEYDRNGKSLSEILETSATVTLIAGFPALLALAVWLFKRPKASVAIHPET